MHKGVKTAPGVAPLNTNKDLLQGDMALMPLPNCNRQHGSYDVSTKVRMAAFTLIQMKRTHRVIAPQLILIRPNLPSVN